MDNVEGRVTLLCHLWAMKADLSANTIDSCPLHGVTEHGRTLEGEHSLDGRETHLDGGSDHASHL